MSRQKAQQKICSTLVRSLQRLTRSLNLPWFPHFMAPHHARGGIPGHGALVLFNDEG